MTEASTLVLRGKKIKLLRIAWWHRLKTTAHAGKAVHTKGEWRRYNSYSVWGGLPLRRHSVGALFIKIGACATYYHGVGSIHVVSLLSMR